MGEQSRRVPGRDLIVALVAIAGCSDSTQSQLRQEPEWTLQVAHCEGFDLAMGDVDGDGFKDLVVWQKDCRAWDGGRETANQIVVFAGKKSGFEADPIASLLFPGIADALRCDLSLLDIDGDGLSDIRLFETTRDFAYSDVETIFLSSQGLLAEPIDVPVDSGWDGGKQLYGDIDGDGRDELVGIQDTFIVVREWIENERQWSTEIYDSAETYGAADAIHWLGDHDGDGIADLVAGLRSDYRIVLGCRASNCNPEETAAQRALPPFASLPWGLGDVDVNGYPDLAMSSTGRDLQLFLASATGTYSLEPSWSIPAREDQQLRAVRRVGDFDLDGFAADLVVTVGNETQLFTSTANGPSLEASYSWPGRRLFGLDSTKGHLLLLTSPDTPSEPVFLEAYSRGSLPTH